MRRLKDIERKVPAALRLRLARVHSIHDWVKPALRQVIFTPLKLLTKPDLVWLGYETYQVIARVREEYEVLRKRLAFTPPPVPKHTAQCFTPKACEQAWKTIWVLNIGRRLQEPITMCALGLGWEAQDAIVKLVVTEMGPGCGEGAKSSATDCTGIRAEEALIDQAWSLLQSTVPVVRSYFTLEY